MDSKTVLVIDDSPTILKVVELVLTKEGYSVFTALDGDEGIEVAKKSPPDLVLLDFVMPKMNGYQVCRELQQDESLKDIPVVLMSAKGDQVGERFVKVMGIVDYITKPFSPEAISALVQHAIAKYAGQATEDSEEEELEVEINLPVEEAEEALDARRNALAAFRDRLSTLAGKAAAIGAANRGEAWDEDEISAWISEKLTYITMEILLGELRALAPELTGDKDVVLAGDLEAVPLAEVLQLLGQQEQRGVLTIFHGNAQVELHFNGGMLQLGTAVGIPEEFLLGRFILDNDQITPAELDQFLESREEPVKLLGIQLVKAGLITEEDLKEALKQQTCEHVYEILRWSSGNFSFRHTAMVAPLAQQAKLGLDIDAILMEGFRRVDEWHLIEREIDDFDQVYLRNEDTVSRMGRGRLTREEFSILELVNGKNSVKEIVRLSRMSSFEVSKMLYRLLSIKLIRKRVQPMVV